MPFRTDINALRAVAVALVVLFHLKIPGFDGGFVGVDIFFVISGYLMTRIVVNGLEEGRFNYIRFVAARAARIWPALAVLILILLVLGVLMLPPSDLTALAHQARSAAELDSNRLFRDDTKGYFVDSFDERWLLHTWSLSVEWQFYLAYPLLLCAVHALTRRISVLSSFRPRDVIGAAIATVLLLSLSICIYKSSRYEYEWSLKAAFFMLPSRAWEMLAGSIVFLVEPRLASAARSHRFALHAAAIVLLAFTLLAASLSNWEHGWPGALAVLPVLAAALFLLGGPATGTGPSMAWMSLAPVQSLGRWSYSVYLWHWPISVALNMLRVNEAYPVAGPAFGVLLSLLLGWLSYRFVEQAFTGPIDRRTWPRMCGIPAVCLGLGLVSAGAIATTAGLPSRLGSNSGPYEAYREAADKNYMPRGCENFQVPLPRLKMCSLHPQSTGPRILVYGDSHAQHLYPWFEAAVGTRVDFLVSGGCPVLPHHNRRQSGYYCDDFWAHVMRTASRPEYTTIVVAARWSVFDAAEPEVCRSVQNKCIGGNQRVSRADMVLENRKEWERLLELGKTVVVLDRIPEPGFNVPRHLSRLLFMGVPVRPVFEDTIALKGSTRYIDVLISYFAARPRFHRVSLRPLICSSTRCTVLDPQTNEPIFSDDNHLAINWIKRRGGVLSPYLQE